MNFQGGNKIISFRLTANAILNQLKVHGLNTTLFFRFFPCFLVNGCTLHTVFFFRHFFLFRFYARFAWLKLKRKMQWTASHHVRVQADIQNEGWKFQNFNKKQNKYNVFIAFEFEQRTPMTFTHSHTHTLCVRVHFSETHTAMVRLPNKAIKQIRF